MKPPAEAWAAWIYRVQMVAITAVMLWDHGVHASFLRETNWPPPLQKRVIEALVQADWARMAIIGLVVVGLVSRNLVRNWSFKLNRNGAEANVHAQGAGA